MNGAIPSRRERRMAETRAAIVAAAQELFEQQGFDETTVDEIAARADVAPRTFFRYFPSKEAVLFAEFEALNARLVASLLARPAEEAPLVALHRACRDYLEQIQAHLGPLARVVRLAEERRGFGLEGAALRQRLVEELTATLAARMGVDARVDPRPSGWVGALLACVGAAIRSAVHSGAPPSERFDQLVADTAQAFGALPPVGAPHPPRRPGRVRTR